MPRPSKRLRCSPPRNLEPQPELQDELATSASLAQPEVSTDDFPPSSPITTQPLQEECLGSEEQSPPDVEPGSPSTLLHLETLQPPCAEANLELEQEPDFEMEDESELESEERPQPETEDDEMELEEQLTFEDSSDDIEQVLRMHLLGDEDPELDISSDSEHEENEVDLAEAKLPLYEGACITLHESFVTILSLILTFKLTGVCLKAILNLIALHLPKTNSFKNSVAFFKKYFSYLQGPKDIVYYCSKCFKKCDPKLKKCKCKGSKLCYLVKISLQHQLQTLFNRDSFYDKLSFSHTPNINGTYADVFDGDLYQSQIRSGALGVKDHLSFQWYNTDGCALYKSSKISVWPFYLTINNLPHKERYKKENVIIPVLWCGPVKPPVNILTEAVYEALLPFNLGVNLNVKGHGTKNIKGSVLTGTGDTPARGIMLNMSQFNGACSFQECEQVGEPRKGVPGVRLFPYKPHEMVPRTPTKMVEYSLKATDLKPFMGVKGPTGLSKIMPNFIDGTAVDPMHQLFGGVGKKVLRLLISSKGESSRWSIHKDTEVLSARLESIRPPAHVPRLPRSLDDVAYFKMNEMKMWLQEYSLAVMDGVLPQHYLRHHSTLVAAVHFLNADVVTTQSVNTARDLMHRYMYQFADFYDPKYLTMNFHLLLHLDKIVKTIGPLWVFSCFDLQSINGVILSLVHGTRWAEQQIAASVQTCLGHHDLVKNLEDSEAKTFCTKLLNRHKIQSDDIVKGSMVLGKSEKVTEVDMSQLFTDITFGTDKVLRFQSLRRGKYIYISSMKQLTCRDSSVAVFHLQDHSQNVGEIQMFLRKFLCKCPSRCKCDSEIFVLIQKFRVVKHFETQLANVTVPNNHQYERTSEYFVVKPEHLGGVCVRMQFERKMYVSKPTNSQERE